jgi:hypothetical protein
MGDMIDRRSIDKSPEDTLREMSASRVLLVTGRPQFESRGSRQSNSGFPSIPHFCAAR